MLTTMAHILMNRNIVNAGNNYQTTITDASVVIIQLTSYLTVGTPGFSHSTAKYKIGLYNVFSLLKNQLLSCVFLEICQLLAWFMCGICVVEDSRVFDAINLVEASLRSQSPHSKPHNYSPGPAPD